MTEIINHPRPESSTRLFLGFLHFGLLVWGGPVPQIAIIYRKTLGR